MARKNALTALRQESPSRGTSLAQIPWPRVCEHLWNCVHFLCHCIDTFSVLCFLAVSDIRYFSLFKTIRSSLHTMFSKKLVKIRANKIIAGYVQRQRVMVDLSGYVPPRYIETDHQNLRLCYTACWGRIWIKSQKSEKLHF